MSELIQKLFAEGFIYLFFYFWFFFIAVLEMTKEFSKYKLVFFFLSFVFLTFFTGLRWETGTDWDSYKELFDTLELNWTFLLNVYAFDLGYVVFNAVIRILTNDYSIFLLIDSFIAVGIVFWFLKKYSPFPNLSVFVFYNAFYVAQFMGSNRRIISLGAGLFVFYYIQTKKYKNLFFWQLLAFLFHRTSIMMLIAFFVPNRRFSTNKIIVILLCCLLIGIPELPFKFIGFLGQFLSSFSANPFVEKLLYYSENKEAGVSESTNPIILMTLSVIKRSIFISFYLYVINKNKKMLDSLTDYFFNLYIVGFAMYLLFNGSPIFQMISTYFTFVEIVLIARIWRYTEINVKLFFIIILFFYGFFQLLSSLNAYSELYIPYRTFLH